ncbi:hypothetical protein BDW75DRAFT_242717 [Aspergillus navahoensis]
MATRLDYSLLFDFAGNGGYQSQGSTLTAGWLFFPESPYWLVRQGKSTQARKSLQRIYGMKEDALYTVEVRRMESENLQAMSIQGSIAHNNNNNNRHTFLGLDLSSEVECFNRINRKRTLTAIFAASGQQMIGATFVIGYATYFLDLIGVKDYFDASIVLYVVMLLASMAAFPLTEIVGRRTMIINPDAGNLGSRVGFIFLGTGLFAAIGGWFLYPETKGISFETMDELYASGTAPRHFHRATEERAGRAAITLQESKIDPPVHVEVTTSV